MGINAFGWENKKGRNRSKSDKRRTKRKYWEKRSIILYFWFYFLFFILSFNLILFFEDNYEKEKEFYKNLLKEENIDLFRGAIGVKGILTAINFLNQLRQYDRKGYKEISFPDFLEILSNIKVHLTEKDENYYSVIFQKIQKWIMENFYLH